MYCSKEIEILKNGRVKPHIQHKGKMCLGGGWNASQMQKHIELSERCRRQKNET